MRTTDRNPSRHPAPRRSLRLAVLACMVALGLLQAMAAAAADPVPQFPGVRNAPDPGELSYGAWFQTHQPVKIVFAVASPGDADLKESLHNAALSIQYLKLKKIDYRIEFVLYGNAVRAADPMSQSYAGLGDLMQALHEVGVDFVVCFNSLDELGMQKSDLYPFMTLVPSGILEIVRREADGYAYIRNF